MLKPSDGPQFPLYIPTKGRHEFMVTSKALTEMRVRHYLIVEPQQVDDYQRSVKAMGLLAAVLPLDMKFKETYELCDDLGLTKSTGPGPARNFAWEHSKAKGHAWHWVMDDNIVSFMRLNKSMRVKVTAPSFWRAMEEFVLRYKNIAMAGPNYSFFARETKHLPPFVQNTRIYSCNLIRNDLPFRWRGRYNEDTIISLDMLKAGWCTVQFNALLQAKLGTQILPGGNTAEFYHAEGKLNGGKYAAGGTDEKSKMLVRVHPDVCELVWRFGRVHHHVDYTPFKRHLLIRKPDAAKPSDTEYGMKLMRRASS
jgi:hypothetical protein